MPNPPRRALIVIDVQNEYFTGQLRIEYPDPQHSLARIGQAMDAAHAAGIPIVVVQHQAPAGAPIFAPGSHGVALHPDIARRPHDLLLTKQLASCFAGTNLADWLREREIDTVTVVGYMTHNCDLSTVIEGMHLGFKMELLSDATGSLPYANKAGTATAEEIHRVVSVVMQARFAAVLTTDEWLACLANVLEPVRDTIFSSNKSARG